MVGAQYGSLVCLADRLTGDRRYFGGGSRLLKREHKCPGGKTISCWPPLLL